MEAVGNKTMGKVELSMGYREMERVRLVRDIGDKAGRHMEKYLPYCYTVTNVRRIKDGRRVLSLSKESSTGELSLVMDITEDMVERADGRKA